MSVLRLLSPRAESTPFIIGVRVSVPCTPCSSGALGSSGALATRRLGTGCLGAWTSSSCCPPPSTLLSELSLIFGASSTSLQERQ